MPLIERAARVTLLTVEGGVESPGPPATEALRGLRRGGVDAELLSVGLDGASTGEVILATATRLGCDLLVKGAYTQSRLRQMIFGGVTRHILSHANLPVLMAH
ncbi:MAG: universal stress protein [Proteobacteria bacterium]|nr:universal stress protein [Pseudomonadota bacterium]